MKRALIHIEWWDDHTGRDVLLSALKAADPYIFPDGCQVLTPDVLDDTGANWGEADLWFIVQLNTNVTCLSDNPFGRAYRGAIDRIRAAGMRVKTAAMDPPDGDLRTVLDWLYADDDD